MQRLVFWLLLIASMVTPNLSSAKVEHRWTLGWAMGSSEAIIRNNRGSDFNLYCPAGESDKAPGFFYHSKLKSFSPRQEATVQIIVDGDNHPFFTKEGHFQAYGRAGGQSLYSLANALAKSSAETFTIEMPEFGIKEVFSLKDAYKTVGSKGNKTVINDCLDN
jgi:hypothetical protein